MRTEQESSSTEIEDRRTFLKETGKKALWAAPLVTVIMTASSQRAQAGDTAYKCDYEVPR